MLYSATLLSELAAKVQHVGGKEARWLHQVPDSEGGRVDMQLSVQMSACLWIPVMIVEVGLNRRSGEKHAQASAYSINVSGQLGSGGVLLMVELVLSPTDVQGQLGWMVVTGCHAEGRLLGRALLWEGPFSAESMDALVCACDLVAQHNTTGTAGAWQVVNPNVSISGERVFKLYDYRHRSVAEDQRRNHELSVRLIPGCTTLLSAPDLCIISYPLIARDDTLSVRHVRSLIKVVIDLHQENIVHGDIRASNVIFSQGRAHLIDFDFAGAPGERKYPKGFNTQINDGARARDASADRPLAKEHDWFAVAALMKRFIIDKATQSDWAKACRAVDDFKAMTAMDALSKHDDVQLTFKPVAESEEDGTGSPPRQ